MPITISAKKKVRQDKKRRLTNLASLDKLHEVLSEARKNPTLENIRLASSKIDQATKKNIIHENKAARLKSRLAKRVSSQKVQKATKRKSKK